ncbi:MAG: hypothetical protein H6672_12190 [Anaerolineaceae bacterium]|nr:hypothetical protein [Anaerolineaceae bacterium]
MMRPNPYILLVATLNFTAVDLSDNRQGRLSRHQREVLSRRIRLVSRDWGMLAGGLAVVGLFLQITAIAWFACAVFVGGMILVWLSFQADLNGVSSVDGCVNLVERLPVPFLSPYYLMIGAHRFPVSRQVGYGFANGHSYRIYYTNGSHTIVSGEVLR